jgi:hypothetical protein
MSHNYHPHCGCSGCCDVELADERRAEYIDQFAPPIAAKLIGSEDFAWGVLVDLSPEQKNWVLQDVGRFFERFHNAPDTPHDLAALAVSLHRELLPIIEAAATEQAEEEIAAEYDKEEAA